MLWLARLEYRFHAWRERRARARGLTPTVTPFPGYGGPEWVRVLGRVAHRPARSPATGSGEYESVRGWRSFASVPVGLRAGADHDRRRDRTRSSPTAAA